MMKLDWSKITPTNFEKLCFKLIEENKFENIKWFGKSGGDKGRDLTADKFEEPLSGIKRKSKWVIQCKRFTNKPPSKTEINDFLVEVEEHNPSEVLIIITNTLTSDTKDWIAEKNNKLKFKVNIWEELDLERELYKHRPYLKEFFPDIFMIQGEIKFYKINANEYLFGCDEHDELHITVNADSYKDAKEKVMDFILTIQENKIKWLK